MVLTLVAVGAVVLLIGSEYTFIIGLAALLAYLYPIKTTLGLAFLALLSWQGRIFKQKLINHFRNKRKIK